jgi:Zn-dependent membrane protease YugP
MAFSGILLAAGFIATWLNIPVEKRANKLALEMMREYGLATEDELQMMAEVYDAYILSYIAQFILEVLRVVQWVLEIIIKMQTSKND